MRAFARSLALASALWFSTTPVLARDRLAVFFAADDAELADNLVEIVISTLAENRDRELVGQGELKTKMDESTALRERGLRGCFGETACRSELAMLSASKEILHGTAERDGEEFHVVLGLSDANGRELVLPVSRLVPANMDLLLPALRGATGDLLVARQRALSPSAAPPGQNATSKVESSPSLPPPPPPAREAERSRSPELLSIIGYGTLGLSVVSFSAAAVLGIQARSGLAGTTRAEKQRDLPRHESDARAANALFVTGGVLAGISAVTLVWSWK